MTVHCVDGTSLIRVSDWRETIFKRLLGQPSSDTLRRGLSMPLIVSAAFSPQFQDASGPPPSHRVGCLHSLDRHARGSGRNAVAYFLVSTLSSLPSSVRAMTHRRGILAGPLTPCTSLQARGLRITSYAGLRRTSVTIGAALLSLAVAATWAVVTTWRFFFRSCGKPSPSGLACSGVPFLLAQRLIWTAVIHSSLQIA